MKRKNITLLLILSAIIASVFVLQWLDLTDDVVNAIDHVANAMSRAG